MDSELKTIAFKAHCVEKLNTSQFPKLKKYNSNSDWHLTTNIELKMTFPIEESDKYNKIVQNSNVQKQLETFPISRLIKNITIT
jgi:DNA polymerase III psi subunit